jgi:hypothetical protein
MSLGGCLRAWIALVALEIILTLAFVPAERLHALIASEIATSRAAVGAAETERIVAAAQEDLHWFIAAVPFAASREPANSEDSPITGATRGSQLVGERLRALAFLGVYRLCWLRTALAPLLACVIAAAIDGLAVRRRRAFTFATTSTVIYNAASYLMVSTSMLPLMYFIAPMPIPVACLPFAGLAVAGAVWTLLAHLPGAAPIVGLRT